MPFDNEQRLFRIFHFFFLFTFVTFPKRTIALRNVRIFSYLFI